MDNIDFQEQCYNQICRIFDSAEQKSILEDEGILRLMIGQITSDSVVSGNLPDTLRDIADHIKDYPLGLPALCSNTRKVPLNAINTIKKFFEANNFSDFSNPELLMHQFALVPKFKNTDIEDIFGEINSSSDSKLSIIVLATCHIPRFQKFKHICNCIRSDLDKTLTMDEFMRLTLEDFTSMLVHTYPDAQHIEDIHKMGSKSYRILNEIVKSYGLELSFES